MCDLMIEDKDIAKELLVCKKCKQQIPRLEEFQIIKESKSGKITIDTPYCWKCFKELMSIGRREVNYGEINDTD